MKGLGKRNCLPAKLLFIGVCLLKLSQAEESLDTVVKVRDGEIRGVAGKSAFTQRNFYQFKGIPYAKAPVGNLRFKAPLNNEPWDGVLDTTAYSPVCPQLNYETAEAEGSENCLFANVFTPNMDKVDELFPVVVLIHGGSFQFESGDSYSPDYLLEENLVLVTFNYRLGLLGFLSSGLDGIIQGNAGLKDQVQLLKWVQANIRSFNGDPNRVTLLGLNSGAVSVHLHMLSPMSEGLFHRGISQSGTSLCPWSVVKKPENRFKELAKYMNCEEGATNELIKECLLQANVTDLVEKQQNFAEWYIDPIVPVGPSVETKGEDPIFLLDSPHKLIREGKFNKNIPWIVGVNSEEGLLHAADIIHHGILIRVINMEWNKAAPITLLYKDTTFDSDRVSDSIRQYYFQDKDINATTLEQLINMYSDRYFFHGTHHAVKGHVQNGASAPIYLYYFDHVGENSMVHLTNKRNKNITGVSHFDQAQYLFKIKDFPEISDEQHDFAKKFIKTLFSFIQTGTPGEPAWRPVELKDVSEKGALHYNVIGTSDGAVKEPFTDRIKFWDSLGLFELELEIDESFIQKLVNSQASDKTEL